LKLAQIRPGFYFSNTEEIMNTYSIALFLHITGALGFFIVLGLEWIGLAQIRSARLPEEARAILETVKRADRLGAASMLTALVTGFYMMLTVWGAAPWLLVMLGSLVLEIALFVAIAVPRMKALEQALSTEKGTISQSFYNLANHPLLWISVRTRVAIVLGFIFLKIVKPDLGWSLLAISIAISLGLASSLPVLPSKRLASFFAIAAVAALGLLAKDVISARTTPLVASPARIQEVQTRPANTQTAGGASNIPTQAPNSSPETALQEGQLLLQERCTQCHSLQKVLQVKRTRTEWKETLAEMESLNVKISDTEKSILLDYLSSVGNP
jgi:hypothetical protein